MSSVCAGGTVKMANAIDARQNWGSILEPGTGQDDNR